MCHHASLWLWVPAFAGTTVVDAALTLSGNVATKSVSPHTASTP
jgi:hypothetical protein